MALIACPDCKTEVSDEAPTCPKCGRAMKQAAKGNVMFTGIVVAVVSAVLYFGWVGGFYGHEAGMFGMLAGGGLFVFGVVAKK